MFNESKPPRTSIFACLLSIAFLLSIVFLNFAFFTVAHADEKVGTFQIDDLILRPTLTSVEDVGARFDLSDSWASFKWSKGKRLSAYLGIGSTNLRNLPVYYNDPNQERIGFFEGYAQYEGIYGRARFGLIPLNFGYDSVNSPSETYFKSALPVAVRLIGQRDYGVSFATENNGYYTELIFHNGEVDTTSDGRLWATANWGYTDNRLFRAQLSIQTGFVEKQVSSTTNTIGGVTPGETAHWRNGVFFLNWRPRGWNAVLQTGGGEVEQGNYEGRYLANMVEVTRFFSKNFGSGFRYDQFDPNRKVSGDAKTEMSLMFLFKSDDSTSNLILLGTKVVEESHEVPNDELRLVWLLTPYTH